MSATWNAKRAKVRATLRRAARLGPQWAAGFTQEAAAGGVPEASTPESVRTLVRSAAALVERRLHDAMKARTDWRAQRARLRPLRLERDAAVEKLYDLVVRLRGMAPCVFGDHVAERMFPSGRTPTRPGDLLESGWRLVSQLETSGIADLRSDSTYSVDLPVFLEGIREKVQRLGTALDELTCAETAEEQARVTRDRALRRLVRARGGLDRLSQALCDLAA